jgi:signal recognition particle subunit SRP68
MFLKSLSEDTATTGATRKQIVSRFNKAQKLAFELVRLLDTPESTATSKDILEATAYASSLKGLEAFELKHWEDALKAFGVARTVYTVLYGTTKSEVFTEQLQATVEPSIRYCAYQLQLPRGMDVATIARQYFPKDESPKIVEELEKLDPQAFADQMDVDTPAAGMVTSVSWRGRTAAVEEADISIALHTAQTAEAAYNSQDQQGSTDAFDAVLLAWQDAVDATRKAIDERQAEGISNADQKMQNLHMTWTMVNYAMICWRVGRNRVMISNIMAPKKSKKGGEVVSEEVSSKKIGHLKEEIALYDAILQVLFPKSTEMKWSQLTPTQSLDQISHLPGVAADETFTAELNAKASYFRALRTSSIAASHVLLNNLRNALALYARASQYITSALPHLPSAPSDPSHAGLTVPPASAQEIQQLLTGQVARYRALVEMEQMAAKAGEQQGTLLDRLNEWPEKVDFQKGIVQWPLRVQPVPVKPVFLDIAWNFIEYPGAEARAEQEQERETQHKRGGSLLGRLWGR